MEGQPISLSRAMSIARLNEIISEKEAKAQRYAPCDVYWLLIVVDFIDAAQEQEIRIDGLTVRSDMFQKIIIYKTGFEHIVELEPQKTRQAQPGCAR